MPVIEAVYQGGVFKPLDQVDLADNQRVRLDIQPTKNDYRAWLAEVQQFHRAFLAKQGPLPDSAAEIAAERLRHE